MAFFTVATWNVENLFRPPASASVGVVARYRDKLALLAAVVRAINPDVLALQELGGEDALADLAAALGGDWPHQAAASPDGRGIRVGFLSRLAFQGAPVEIAHFPPGPALAVQSLDENGQARPSTRMGRAALRVRVRKANRTVNVLTAHLKSKLLSYPRPQGVSFTPRDEAERAQVAGIALHRRTAEAVTLRLAANTLLEGNDRSALVILGDLNDVPDAQTSLLLAGPEGSVIGTSAFHRADAGDDARLFSLAPLIPAERRYSRVHAGRGELLDQIWASVEFFPRVRNGKRMLAQADAVVDFAGALPSVGENPAARAAATAPDHAPVHARFALG
jgi:endonuclease/exonuclease/phosphatase family metal-dependent hydrolase